MTITDAYGDRRTAEVLQDTWGHLIPSPTHEYPGVILFAHGEFGDLVALRTEFADLPDSPWFYEDLNRFLMLAETERGQIYRFTGKYSRPEDDFGIFTGETVPVTVPTQAP